MTKLLTIPHGLCKVNIINGGDKYTTLVEYTGIHHSPYGIGDCSGCGKDVKTIHTFTEYDSVEDYLAGKGGVEYAFGVECVKKHIKVLENVVPFTEGVSIVPTVMEHYSN